MIPLYITCVKIFIAARFWADIPGLPTRLPGICLTKPSWRFY